MAHPFHAIQRRDDAYVVVAKSSGRVLGRHRTRDEALEQLRAVEFSEHGGRDNPPRRTRRPRRHMVRGIPRVEVWEERDRSHVALLLDDTDIANWWDNDVEEMVEDGFFDPRRIERSVIEYAESVGIITSIGNGRFEGFPSA